MSCGCGGGAAGGLAHPPRNALKFAAVVAVAWAIAKREWGLLVLGLAAFIAYRASKRSPGAAVPAGASGLSAPDSFSTGTTNTPGSPSPTTTVPGSSSSNPGDCS